MGMETYIFSLPMFVEILLNLPHHSEDSIWQSLYNSAQPCVHMLQIYISGESTVLFCFCRKIFIDRNAFNCCPMSVKVIKMPAYLKNIIH